MTTSEPEMVWYAIREREKDRDRECVGVRMYGLLILGNLRGENIQIQMHTQNTAFVLLRDVCSFDVPDPQRKYLV